MIKTLLLCIKKYKVPKPAKNLIIDYAELEYLSCENLYIKLKKKISENNINFGFRIIKVIREKKYTDYVLNLIIAEKNIVLFPYVENIKDFSLKFIVEKSYSPKSTFFNKIIIFLNKNYNFSEKLLPYNYFIYNDVIMKVVENNDVETLKKIINSINRIGYDFYYYTVYKKALNSKKFGCLDLILEAFILQSFSSRGKKRNMKGDPINRFLECRLRELICAGYEKGYLYITNNYKQHIPDLKLILKSYDI